MLGIVERHNYWREKVGVPPLKWSTKLARVAQKWANHLAEQGCKMYHSPRNKGRKYGNIYGENLYWSNGVENTSSSAVDAWASEIQYFNETTGKCKGGICGHYTQLVWRNTTQVGCAMAICGHTEIWVCNYNPSGNWKGQRPY